MYLLNHHFNIKAAHINYVAGQFDLAYRVSSSSKSDNESENSENLALAVIRSFDDLAKKLRSLDVELDVTSVLGKFDEHLIRTVDHWFGLTTNKTCSQAHLLSFDIVKSIRYFKMPPLSKRKISKYFNHTERMMESSN